MYIKKQYKSLIIKNHIRLQTKKKKIDGVRLKG